MLVKGAIGVFQSDVLGGVSLSAWRSDWSASWGDRHAFLKIEPPGALMQVWYDMRYLGGVY